MAQENIKLKFLQRQHSEAALLRQRSCFNVLSTVGESIEADCLSTPLPPAGNIYTLVNITQCAAGKELCFH